MIFATGDVPSPMMFILAGPGDATERVPWLDQEEHVAVCHHGGTGALLTDGGLCEHCS
jgi:hypothetical protein